MRLVRWSALWGVLLILAGGLLLLEALDVFAAGGLIWAVLFGAGSVGFAYVFFTNRESWWAAIPAGVLLGLAALIAWGELGPSSTADWGAALFFGGIGIGFLATYLTDNERWWAVIPGGVMFTLAAVTGLSSILEGTAISGVLFLGLAATFGLLAVLPTDEGRMRWPLIPAAVLGLLGVLFAIEATTLLNAFNYLWPVALIVGGLYLILRALGSGRKPRPHA